MPAQNLLIRSAPVPSIGLAASKAANIRRAQAATQGAQTRNLLAEKQLATFDEDRAFQLEQHEWARSLRDWEMAKRPQERLEAFGKGLKIYARHSTLQTHDQTIAKLAKAYPGIDTSTIPTAEQIASQAPAGTDPAQYYEQWKMDTLTDWDDKVKIEVAKITAAGKESPADKLQRAKELAQYKEGIKPPKETPEEKLERDKELAYYKEGIKSSAEAKQSDVTKYELVTYGKLRPELRGTPEYKKGFLSFARDIKEQSPYVDALNRQVEVTAKREGTNLRKEFYDQVEVKEANDIKRKYEVMTEAFNESKKTNNFVAVDQAIITLFNKMTDPQSVVRESEYARTASDLALWHRVKGKVSKWVSGGAGLSQNDREAVFKMAGKFQEIAQRKYKARLHEYKGYLSNYGLDPDKYLTPYGGDQDMETDLSNLSDAEIMEQLNAK